MDNLGAEIRYSKSNRGEKVLKLDKSLGLYLKPILHISEEFDIYGLLGVAQTTLKRVRNVQNNKSKYTDFSYGIGLNYNFHKNYALYTDYVILADEEKTNCKIDVKQWNIGIAYYWSKQKKKEPKKEIVKEVKKAPVIPMFIGKIEPIYFDNDKTFLKPRSIDILDFVADMMNKYPNLKIAVVGHADSKFNKVYNMNLSQRRANKARKYLIVKHKIDRNRLSASAKGETQIIKFDGINKEDMPHSRRVEFEIISR
jgi:outer membrane protein OmpA-like peptidoglycan-associated protein